MTTGIAHQRHPPARGPDTSKSRYFRLPLPRLLPCNAPQAPRPGSANQHLPQASWQVNPEQLLAELVQARCHKTGYELACLREATHVGVLGHLAAEQAFRNGASEFDIHLAFLAAIRQNESELP